MKLYLGLLPSSPPDDTRIFGEIDGLLIDHKLAYATYLAKVQGAPSSAYDLAGYFFPKSIGSFLERGELARRALDEVADFAHRSGAAQLCGPAGEKIAYAANEVRLLPPLLNPEKSFVIGFADRARVENLPRAEIPTGFYKLPQTFMTDGAPVAWPNFSQEVDADGSLAIVIGKAGKRIAPERAWDHVGGATLMVDITARDINRREGLTANNLLGKNFPSSTGLGPAVLIGNSPKDLRAIRVELFLDGALQQSFSLGECVFTVEQIIARWSILGIKPGDWFAIGASMALKGNRLQDPVPLKLGSTIRCFSPVLGELSHEVVAAGGVNR